MMKGEERFCYPAVIEWVKGENQVKIAVFFTDGVPPKIKFYEHFVFFNFLIRRSPEAPRAL